ncbi:hypothetical protein ACIQU5_28040 [Streptomyces sp. NPDC090306]|uniref:hypothetical protein n=1 Tax=Streptomyces sp. NPDC090306 TaxID=3365961 RepID=UPI00381F0EA2
MTSIEFGRPFVLHRSRDISDVSGTGIIADGAVWPDGHAVIHWRGRWPLTTPHPDGLDSILAIHDHGGQGDLDVIWADPDPDPDTVLDATRDTVTHAYDTPSTILGPNAALQHLRRHLDLVLAGQPQHVDAVMPIAEQLMAERDQAQAVVTRVQDLAARWGAAAGPGMGMVRAAGAELDAVICDDTAATTDSHFDGAGSGPPADCPAQYHGHAPASACVRAEKHRGDHIDENGFHWSDTVALYPSASGQARDPALSPGFVCLRPTPAPPERERHEP